MPFVIEQNLCAQCGSCIGNCPNRAIIRKGDLVFITEMCSDCGMCVQYCGMSAIAKGERKSEFDSKKLDKALKEKLSLKRGIVAMKFADKDSEETPGNDELNFWCNICGDIFEGEGKPLFFTGKNSMCGGSTAMGLGSRGGISREDFNAVMEGLILGDGCYFANKEVLTKPRTLFPIFPKIYKGMVIGSLEHVKMPDIVLIPLTGHQMCVVATAYGFDTGEVIMGNAGPGACMATVITPFLENKPVFTPGDHGGRSHMRLKDEEILLCLPYRLVPGLLRNIDRTAYGKKE